MENLYVNTRDERGKARRQFSVYLIYPGHTNSHPMEWIRNFEPPCLLLCCVSCFKVSQAR